MDRKIKSVKLAEKFNNGKGYAVAGDKVHYSPIDNLWYLILSDNDRCYCSDKTVRENSTGLFDIEYETERKSITVKIEYDYSPGDSPLSVTNIAYSLDGDYNINPKVREVTND